MATSRGTTRPRRGFVYYPITGTFYPYWKIKITDDDDVVHWISDFTDGSASKNYLISASVTRTMTKSLSRATVKFDNSDGTFTDTFNGGEVIEIYADYTDGTTLQFRGKLDDINYGVTGSTGFTVSVTARDYPELIDTSVIGQATASLADVALSALLYEYYSDIKLDFWNGSAWVRATYDSTARNVTWSGASTGFPETSITMSYQNKKGWTVISDMCKRVGLECYMDYDTSESVWVLRIFLTDEIQNNSTSVVYGNNLVSVSNYGKDNTGIANNITVYGKTESSNILLMATETDTSSIADLWQKDRVIDDANLTTMSEVREKAETELAESIQSIYTGRLNAVGIHNIKPGEQIMISVPNMNISGYVTISNYVQKIGSGGFTTTIDVKREDNRFTDLFKEKLNIEEEAKAFNNLNAMTDSYTVYFDEDPSVMSHSDTEETEGKLVLSSGKITGIATSESHTANADITECEFRKYSNFPVDEGDVYGVSNDGGTTWETYTIDAGVHTFSSTGSHLKFRITLNRTLDTNTSPAYEAVTVLYK